MYAVVVNRVTRRLRDAERRHNHLNWIESDSSSDGHVLEKIVSKKRRKYAYVIQIYRWTMTFVDFSAVDDHDGRHD